VSQVLVLERRSRALRRGFGRQRHSPMGVIISSMAAGMVAAPPCVVCGQPSARVELVAPGQVPAGGDQWDDGRRDAFRRRRDPARWHLLFEGVAAGNGWGGDPIEAGRARRIAEAFRRPWSFARVRAAGFHDDAGLCGECDAAYCCRHWQVSDVGFGHCPAVMARALTHCGDLPCGGCAGGPRRTGTGSVPGAPGLRRVRSTAAHRIVAGVPELAGKPGPHPQRYGPAAAQCQAPDGVIPAVLAPAARPSARIRTWPARPRGCVRGRRP